MTTALYDWLALALTERVGPVGFLRLIKAFGSASQARQASFSALESCVGPEAAKAIQSNQSEPSVVATLAWAEQDDCALLTLLDDDYPSLLAHVVHPPPLLFLRGQRSFLRRPMVAIVGSRQATTSARKTASDFAKTLSESDYTVVSGLASGIDAAAHEGALEQKGSTLAVVGTGIDLVYPASNKALAQRIAKDGLIVSEFPLGMSPLAGNFPRRNRIIAGLARGCLVVEADLKSGSLITARLALESGRDVFAVPGSIHNPQTKGCHQLIKEGAKLVENAYDILDEWVDGSPQSREAASAPHSHAPEYDSLLKALGFEPMTIDELVKIMGLTMPDISVMLLELELSGHVVSLPGGRYQRLLGLGSY